MMHRSEGREAAEECGFQGTEGGLAGIQAEVGSDGWCITIRVYK